MRSIASVNSQLDELLEQVCVSLQLSPTQYEDAKEKYEAVGRWLSAPESTLAQFRPEIYSQGSMRHRTTTKPRNQEEFDLDLMCEIQAHSSWFPNPMGLYEAVEKRLQENRVYAEKLERFKRCLRLNYAGDFHLDVTPAIPSPSGEKSSILVPDRTIRSWVSSNPAGFAEWFERRSVPHRQTMAASLEPLPPNQSSNRKPPLKRAVQLLKRHRNIVFGGADNAPRSIVLTTLAANHYDGGDNVTDVLIGILDGILGETQRTTDPLVIRNPTNLSEVFSEAWIRDPSAYVAFVEFIQEFRSQLHTLLHSTGFEEISGVLNDLFGKDIGTRAIAAHARHISDARDSGQLRFEKHGATLTTVGTSSFAVPRNTFYGD